MAKSQTNRIPAANRANPDLLVWMGFVENVLLAPSRWQTHLLAGAARWDTTVP
jgi:hypothetical protein